MDGRMRREWVEVQIPLWVHCMAKELVNEWKRSKDCGGGNRRWRWLKGQMEMGEQL